MNFLTIINGHLIAEVVDESSNVVATQSFEPTAEGVAQFKQMCRDKHIEEFATSSSLDFPHEYGMTAAQLSAFLK